MSHVAANLDWVALLLGTVGTVVWAHNGRHAKYAALWWFASSLFWIAFAFLKGLPALGVRDLISVVLYAYGCYRWVFARGQQGATSVADGA